MRRTLRLYVLTALLAFWWRSGHLAAQDDDPETEDPVVDRVDSVRSLQERPRKKRRATPRARVVREKEAGRFPRRWSGLEIQSVADCDEALRRRLDESDMATLDDVLAQSGEDYLTIVARGPGVGARMDSLAASGLLRRFVPLLYVREGRASARSFVADLDLRNEPDLRFESADGQCPEFRPLGRIVSASAFDYGPEPLCRLSRVERHEIALLCLSNEGLDHYVSLKVVAWVDVNRDGLEDVVITRESCDLHAHGYCNSDVFVATRRSARGSFHVLDRWHPLRFAKVAAADGVVFCGQAVLPTTDSIDCGEKCVADLEPLRKFPDITRLDLRGSGVRDLSAVANLTRLESLFLSDTNVTDLKPLSGLKGLKMLTLAGTQIRDLEPLSTVSNLEYLDLSRTQVTDLSPLNNLAGLRSVLFSGPIPPGFKARVQAASAPPIKPTSDCCAEVDVSVRRLDLRGDEPMTVWSIRGIERLEHLEELDLSGTMVADLTPLAKLKHLRVLNLAHTSVADLAPLAGISSLEELDLRGTQVRSLEALGRLNNLRVLWINRVESLRGLEGAGRLEELVLSDSPVTDLGPIASCRQLRTLHADGTGLTSIDPLVGLTALERVDLSRTAIISLAGLAMAKGLRSLSLVGAPVRDLSPLRDHPTLQRLDLGHSGVDNLDALGAPTALKFLDLRGLRLAPSQGLSLPASLVEVNIRDARVSRALEARFAAAGVRLVRTKDDDVERWKRPW